MCLLNFELCTNIFKRNYTIIFLLCFMNAGQVDQLCFRTRFLLVSQSWMPSFFFLLPPPFPFLFHFYIHSHFLLLLLFFNSNFVNYIFHPFTYWLVNNIINQILFYHVYTLGKDESIKNSAELHSCKINVFLVN